MRVLLVLYRFRGLALLVCCASFAPVTLAFSAEPQAIMTVTTSDDELNHDGDCSLREAIQAAHQRAAVDACLPGTGHDVIELAAETYILRRAGRSENAGAVGDLDIAGDLTILGAGAATTLIEGGRVDRVLDVLPGGQLTLVGITVRNGEALDQRGSGIANAGTTTVIASVVEGNVVAGEDSMPASPYPTGGGINTVGTLTVIDSIIRNNAVSLSIPFPHDSTANAGGGIASSGALTVIRSTISENSGIHGGGIYASGTLNLSHSVVRDNAVGTLSGGQGGGIFNRRGGSATIAHSQILHNTTFGRNGTSGGGIANAGEMVVSTSMISANDSHGLMDGGSFGGGILNAAGAVLTLVGSTVHENVASGAYMGSGYGGGIANEGHLIVENSTISGNRTSAGTTMSDGSFSGGIDNYRGRVELFNSTISANTSAQAQDVEARGAGIGNEEGVVTLHTNYWCY